MMWSQKDRDNAVIVVCIVIIMLVAGVVLIFK